MTGLDSSVLVRLLTGQPPDLYRVARGWVIEAYRQDEPVIATDVALAETWYALKLHYGLPADRVRQALGAMFDSALVQPEPGSGVRDALEEAPGAGFVDRLLHARHRQLGGTTLTLDEHLAKLPGATLLGAP